MYLCSSKFILSLLDYIYNAIFISPLRCFGSTMLPSDHYRFITVTYTNPVNNNHYVMFKTFKLFKAAVFIGVCPPCRVHKTALLEYKMKSCGERSSAVVLVNIPIYWNVTTLRLAMSTFRSRVLPPCSVRCSYYSSTPKIEGKTFLRIITEYLPFSIPSPWYAAS
jgi:hypothetical protein